ncbi:COMPASS component SDC1 [Daldinia childiae]|uniref:COMPASS component SDC1 n=1 Tax=Daldinia childiae TaxID=326645 RepID=UPI001445A2EF|nr:COMPASS component SDC1 [Daldinia childiae]KAF3062320.1 COMPASS component SDC1 [Daldinia childiae]
MTIEQPPLAPSTEQAASPAPTTTTTNAAAPTTAPAPASATTPSNAPSPSLAAAAATTATTAPPARTGTPLRATNSQQETNSSSRAASQHPDPGFTMPAEAPPHGAPVRQYLNSKVTGPLLDGMKMIAKERPKDPLRALGEYLIQRSKELESTT